MNLKNTEKWGLGVKGVSQPLTSFEKLNPSLLTNPLKKIVQGMYPLHYNIYGDIIWDKKDVFEAYLQIISILGIIILKATIRK